jgi:hypothetical protein
VTAAGETFAHYQIDTALEQPAASATDLFLATDTRAGAEVLLEIVRPGASGIERARFGTRARRLAGVKHPSLLTAVDVAATHCAFEAPRGMVLTEHAGIAIARSRQKLFWLSQIAGALAALHKSGIVHGRLSLDAITIQPDASVKLAVPLGGDVSGSPLDDVRAFAVAACELVVGSDAAGDAEATVAERVHEAGVPPEAAAWIARIRAGGSMTSEDLADKLAPFAEYSGPSTEPLLAVVPRRD